MNKKELKELAGEIYESAITNFWDTASVIYYDEVKNEKEGDSEIIYWEIENLLNKQYKWK